MRSVISKSVILGSWILAGCSTLPSAEEYHAQLQSKLRTVKYDDGIDQQESKTIADAYLDEHITASFGHIGPFDGGTNWVFKITGDIAPIELTNIPPVLVDKCTGAVTWDQKPPLKK